MSERNRSDRHDRHRRGTSSPARPARRLPQRVYWVRRLLVLGVAALLVLGLTRLLSYGGSDDGGGKATIVRSEPTPTVTESTALSPTVVRPGKKGRLPQPDGPCEPSDLLVTPVVRNAHVAQPVRIVLEVTSLQSPACTFQVSSRAVILRLLSEKRSEPLWSSQQCRAVVPEQTVVARQTKPGKVAVFWNGRTSDSGCTEFTDWVFPGTYTAQAIAVGSTRATSSEFVLGLALRPTVTMTPTPTETPTETQSPKGTPSGRASSKPSGSPTGR
jgi:hypothetical protein